MHLPVLSAILGILAFPLAGWWPLAFIYLVPLFLFFIKEQKFSRLVAGAIIFRAIFELGLGYFAFEPLLLLLSIALFLAFPVSYFLLRRLLIKIVSVYEIRGCRDNEARFWRLELSRAPAVGRDENNDIHLRAYWLNLFFLPALWTICDLVVAQYTFLPRYVIMAGNALGGSPFLGLAKFGGILGLTFFAALVNSLLTYFFYRGAIQKIKISRFLFFVVLVIIFGGLAVSRIKLNENSILYNGLSKEINFAAVSVDKAFSEKFSFLAPRADYRGIYKELRPIAAELAGKNIDLAILPEKMIEAEWDNTSSEANEKFGIENQGAPIEAYRELAKEINSNVAATLITFKKSRRYITTVLIDKNGRLTDFYDKSHLTIASEYWPFGDWRPFYFNWLKNARPDLGEKDAIFNPAYQYASGKRRVLDFDNAPFASLICIETHYPFEVYEFKNLGAKFISHTSSNLWIRFGLNQYLGLISNLRKIESVRLGLPIVFNGRMEPAGIVTPDGRAEFANFESQGEDFSVFFGKIKYQ